MSRIARQVENVRGLDIDYVQYCPECKNPQLFAEVKPYEVHDREWEMTRRFAMLCGHHALAILVVEKEDGIGVKKFSSHSGLTSILVWGKEDYLLSVLENARDIHVCY